jgi:hypothetical protein
MNENLKKTIFSEENISNNVMKEIVKNKEADRFFGYFDVTARSTPFPDNLKVDLVKRES